MKLLFLCYQPPYPPTDGARIRMYNIAKVLADTHSVDVISISYGGDIEYPPNSFSSYDVIEKSPIQYYFKGLKSCISKKPSQVQVYRSRSLANWVENNVDNYDLVYCSHLPMAEYGRNLDVPSILDFVDAISSSYNRISHRASFYKRPLYKFESIRAKSYEQEVAQAFTKCLITTESGKNAIGASNIEVVANGVSENLLHEYSWKPTNSVIGFVGDLSYIPNVSGINWFVKEVLPIIQEREDSVKLKIIGKNPPKKILNLDRRPDINVTGFVDDPFHHMSQVSVSVVPIRSGGGIQNKLLESLAIGVPTVSTTFGAGGIDVTDKRHLLVANNAEVFAERVVDLLMDRSLATRISENGQRRIEDNYTWKVIGKDVTQVIQKSIHERRE